LFQQSAWFKQVLSIKAKYPSKHSLARIITIVAITIQLSTIVSTTILQLAVAIVVIIELCIMEAR